MLSREAEMRVLVVDDNENVLCSIKDLLNLAGFNVNTVGNGEDALRKIKSEQYDLLILDVTMPGIDGVKLFQLIKNSEEYRNIPVLFTSGFPIWADPEEQRREIFEKAEAYLQKPFNIQIFIETVRRLSKRETPANGSLIR